MVRAGDSVLIRSTTCRVLGVSGYDGIVSPAYSCTSTAEDRPPGSPAAAVLRRLSQIRGSDRRHAARRTRDLQCDEFESINLPLPSLPAQRAIADYLDRETARIDALIAAKRRMVELLEERGRGYHRVTAALQATTDISCALDVSSRLPTSLETAMRWHRCLTMASAMPWMRLTIADDDRLRHESCDSLTQW